jgi:predicted metalloprotease
MQMDGDESSNIEDRRGERLFRWRRRLWRHGAASPSRRGRGGMFKGGLGFVAFIVIALIFGADPFALLGGGGDVELCAAPTRPAGPRRASSRPATPRRSSCRACSRAPRMSGRRLPRARPAISRAQAGALPRRHAHRVRRRPVRDGAVLLPGRPAVYLDLAFFEDLARRFHSPGSSRRPM